MGSYVLERRLGAGAMGEVWLGRHASSGGLGAVKILRREAAASELVLRCFHREAFAISKLRHPHVVALFEIGEHHLVYQYIDGQDLARRLRTPMDPATAIRLVRQIASALSHAHERGLVHRDVKPANVLLDKGGNAYLSDFGLVAFEEERPGVSAGTPAYAAPEQWSAEPVSAAADQYALGRTLCEMLAGTALPQGSTDAIAALPEDLPPALVTALRRALATRPSERFPTVAALSEALALVDVSTYPAPVRLLEEARHRAHYVFLSAPASWAEVAPGLGRADYSLGSLAEKGLLPAGEVARFFKETGYEELSFSLYASTERLGPVTDPACLARARELSVLLHGWGATRETWEHVAPAVCRDNAASVVLVPDYWGFGGSPFSKAPGPEKIALSAQVGAVRRLVELLGLARLPAVLVGHSLSATALLQTSDADLGPHVSRVVINPVLPPYNAQYQKRARGGIWIARTIARIPGVHGWFLRKLAREAPSVQELTLEVRERMVEEALRVSLPLFVETFEAVLAAPRLLRGPHHKLLLLIGNNDPLISEEALAAAIADLKLTPGQLTRLATGGHYPHLESAAHPEHTARNVAEIAYLIGQMLLAAEAALPSSLGTESTVASDSADTVAAATGSTVLVTSSS